MLEYAAPVVAAGSEVVVELGNVAPWQARTGWETYLIFGMGLLVVGRGWQIGSRWWRSCGLALVGASFLSIHGGAVLFFGIVALMALAWWLPRLREVLRGLKRPRLSEAVAAGIALAAFCFNDARAAEIRPAESMIHDWEIQDGRLRGSTEITLRGEAGDRFLLLRAPAVLSGFEGPGLRVVKALLDGAEAYFVVAETDGRLSGQAVFEMALADPEKSWELPGGPAAMRQVSLRWDQGGWEFFSSGTAELSPLGDLAANESGAVMVLGPADPVSLQARPKQRDAGSEETRFFAEISNLFLPGPGVVNGRHRVAIRPAQGRVSMLVMTIPEGFMVSDVGDGPVGSWRFDPEERELRVPVEPAQDHAFVLTAETQRAAGTLPMDLELAPLKVSGAAGELGFLALAFSEEAQPETVDVVGLSRVDPGDFDAELLPCDAQGNPLALVQHAFRYAAGEVLARVKVTAVAPELRAESWQLVSLGEDRLLVASDLTVTITRSGVFRRAVELPDGLELVTATGEGLSHWTEGEIEGKRVITLHLTGKTWGKRDFKLTLSGHPPGALEDWQVPRLSVRDASCETGVLTVVPERGLQVRAVGRNNISQIDPRELAEAANDSARAATRPGALAYRLLQADWSLGLAVSRPDPWVTARVFHEASLREGQMLTRVLIDYRIENAALKALRVRIPGLDATAAATVRASGAAVADQVPVEGEPGLWEILFQRGVAGETRVELEYQRNIKISDLIYAVAWGEREPKMKLVGVCNLLFARNQDV